MSELAAHEKQILETVGIYIYIIDYLYNIVLTFIYTEYIVYTTTMLLPTAAAFNVIYIRESLGPEILALCIKKRRSSNTAITNNIIHT